MVVLVNHDQIYEALYDVLNQRYISRTSRATGKVKRMLRLAIGARSQLCPVAEGFRVVVIAEQVQIYPAAAATAAVLRKRAATTTRAGGRG